MKALFAIVLLAAAVLSSEAAPSHGVQLYKNDLKMLVLTEAGSGKLHDIWSICSSSSDPAKVLNITIVPDPPKKGSSLNLTATLTLNEEVTGGQIEIDLKWGFLPINQKVDLCDALKQAGRSCPLQAGTQTISVVQTIPGDAPSGHYTGKAYVRDQSGKELVCIDLDFRM